MGHFPTGVTIVTGLIDGHPWGVTIGSFTSVSLDPPLVGFLPMQSTVTWQQIAESGRFCVNVLGIDQADACWRFAKPPEESRFDGVSWKHSDQGMPVIEGTIAWIDCSVEQVYEMGDHLFVLGRVIDLNVWDGPEPAPLLFFRGQLGGFAKL